MNASSQNSQIDFWSASGIVAQREITVRLRSKSFIISTIIMLIFIVAAVVLMPRIGDLFGGPGSLAVTPETTEVAEALEGYELVEVADEAAAREAVANGQADNALVTGDNPTGLLVISDREVSTTLVELLSVSPEVELLDENAPNPFLAMFIAIGFGVVWFSSALTFGSHTANSVVEEKQTRIVEMLLASVPARALLTGKVLGSAVIAIAQVAAIGLAAILGAAIGGNSIVLDGLAEPILWFIVLFALGFVMISALYAAGAALVSRTEDIPATTQPITWLIMLPYIAIIIFFNNPLALQIMSYIPFSAPVAVPVRLFLGSTEWWEPLLSLAIMFVTTALLIFFSARVYENSLLRTGKAMKWREALRPSA
ncbi:MAG TPA: ABC transporter permease [Candidatus Agrococcus pullicola]|uniref:ABC transporter permease n=1 Tax=Candidatus Agrococcus pullicola TaxID=2838429 RepID=A0A9D1YX29_9MICO|nr:ABC transporter permease [Candidatus Agrococcus pullicola]